MAKKPLTRPAEAVEFLRLWAPEGPWVLTAIDVHQKGIATRTFYPRDEEALTDWIETRNKDANLYFSVNPPTRDLTKKAERTDIKSMAWLHVDIDPRAGEDFDRERERALKLLQEPPGTVPPATVIIDSGGGFQGFWKLEDPVPIEGDLSKAEDAKLWNLQLEVIYDGDNCHNVDRIMRLPGTVNLPNSKKRKKGRRPAEASLVEFHEDRVYPLEKFEQARPIQDGGLSSGTPVVTVSGNVQRLGTDDLMDLSIPDWTKVVIAQGHDPDNPTRYKSRSHAQWAVTCELVRQGVKDEVIFSLLTDPDWPISGHILAQPRPSQYALKQIARGHQYAIHPKLAQLNEKHAVIGDIGGKCRVVTEIWDAALGRPCLSFQSFGDYRNRYLHEQVVYKDANGQDRSTRLGDWWLRHTDRRNYDSIAFAPGKEPEGVYNLWRGFNCEARPGGDFQPYLDHIRVNICDGNEDHYEYVVNWMARAVQRPDLPGYSAIIMRGDQGTGKSFFVTEFGKLWGHHFVHVSDSKHLVGSFNAHLRDCVVLFGDEAFFAGDRQHASVLKMLITEETITIEAKYMDAVMAPNCVHLLMASNDAWVVPAGYHERRFLVLETGRSHQDDRPYFKAIKAAMDAGGREALLHQLLHRDLSSFDVRAIPRSKALTAQKLLSFTADEEWWFTKLREGKVLPEHATWETDVFVEEIVLEYVDSTRRSFQSRRSNATACGAFLGRVLPEGFPGRRQLRETIKILDPGRGREKIINRPWVYVLPSLQVARDWWDDRFGGPYEWPEIIEGGEDEGVPF